MPTPNTPAGPVIVESLAAALAAAQGEFPAIERRHEARIQPRSGKPGYTYRYADLADMIAAVRPVLAKHGLSFTQTTMADANGTLVLVTTLMHTGGEVVRSEVQLPDPRDPQPFGAATTYLRRYQLAGVLGVAPEDDRDGQDAATPTAAADHRAESATPAQMARLRREKTLDEGRIREAYRRLDLPMTEPPSKADAGRLIDTIEELKQAPTPTGESDAPGATDAQFVPESPGDESDLPWTGEPQQAPAFVKATEPQIDAIVRARDANPELVRETCDALRIPAVTTHVFSRDEAHRLLLELKEARRRDAASQEKQTATRGKGKTDG